MDSTTIAPTTVAPPAELQEEKQEETLILRLRPQNDGPRVTWAEGVIDNEHMGRLKSNCCCIYTRPRMWDDPSTWEQDEHETEHCRGHTLPPDQEKKHRDHEDKEHGDKEGHHGPGCC